MLFMGQKPGSMCLEEQVKAVQPRQVGGEAAHQQVGGEAAHQQVGGEAAHQQVGGCPRGSSIGLEPGSMSKAALAQLRQKPQEELDLAIFNTKYGVLVIEELLVGGRLQVHFGDFNIHRWPHWVWTFAALERSIFGAS